MDINIFSTWWFIFFLLIILVWYLFVEVLFWDKYLFRYTFEKYNNNFVDRLFHYIFWGIILNIALFYLYSFADWLKSLWWMYNVSVKFSEILKPVVWSDESIKFIPFSISYFLWILGLMAVAKVTVKVMEIIIFIWKYLIDRITPLKKEKKK
ncbi:MAG: hypothetical protein ACD_4C00022G0004 [uncultured bacterium (gcode 4)]|uniref:Uncharacterized protein n=1 Tax=uncultured bacterium (gcode 4) TaxID=1234023 RepID=K2F7P1_9BACT|nr:MAG: hypothetical protein ACD_4C00022G0004 [uncultured bacterium (gcode 4)]